MAVEGIIREVMETWPLQLVLEGPSGPIAVTLDAAPVVREADGRPADLRRLRPGQRIRVDGREIRLLDR